MDFCAVAVALGAILGVIVQPIFVLIAEMLEFGGFFQRFPLLIEGDLEIFLFGFQYLGIIDGFLFIEHRPCSFESCVLLDAQ